MTSADVIVIGSGPAGCAAAAICVKAGINVLIVTDVAEQNKLSASDPEPLESIHPGVSSLLAKIGAAGAELLASRAFYSGIYAGDQFTALGADSEGNWQGMHIDRKIFDSRLLDHIRDLGVPVRFSHKVEGFLLENGKVIGIHTGSTKLYANYIIDASGKKAVAGKKLNFKRKFFSPPLLCWTGVSGYFDKLPFDQNAAHFIPGKEGWTWLAPQPPDLCSWTRLSGKGEKSFLPPDELKDYPVIGKIHFGNMRWRLFRPICSEGILLCGDAAGILDPAAGQGIFNALFSGIVAGNIVASCLVDQDVASFHLAYYDNWFMEQFEIKVHQLRQYYLEHRVNIFPESKVRGGS